MTTPQGIAPTLPPVAPARAGQGGDTAAGFAFALSAYLLWGFLPFYMKAVAHVPVLEVIAHRVVWAVPIAALLIALTGGGAALLVALRSPRTLALAALTALLIAVNWCIYVWAVASGRALETALGYYINPLFSVALGALLLGERLTRLKLAALVLASLAVLVLTVEAGGLPLVALGLTVTWGFYALAKRTLPIGPVQGFLLEVLILLPVALVLLARIEASGTGHFVEGTDRDRLLLLLAGLVTAVPLILYAYGARGLRLSTIGILQYIAPTMIFLIAVFVFEEPFGAGRAAAFALIWAAVALYALALVRERRARAVAPAEPPRSAG